MVEAMLNLQRWAVFHFDSIRGLGSHSWSLEFSVLTHSHVGWDFKSVTPSSRLLLVEGALGTIVAASSKVQSCSAHRQRTHSSRVEPTHTLRPVFSPEHRVLGVSREEPHRLVLSPLSLQSGSPRPKLPVGRALGFPAEIQHHSTTPGSGRSVSTGCHTDSCMQASENMAARQDSLQPRRT